LGAVFIAGTRFVFISVPGAQHENQRQDALVAQLLRVDATRIYADYWTCDLLIFQSQERIMCGVLDTNLNPGQDRYPLYPAIVKAHPHPAYVFPVGSPQALAFAHQAAQPNAHYQRLILDGYVIYLPVLGSHPGT
jgi:hypothetical protein